MLRYVQTIGGKPVKNCYAAADMKRGAPVTVNYATGDLVPATANTGLFLVDVDKNYDGINAVIEPTDGDFENIKAGHKVLRVAPLKGERYATTEVDTTGLAVGDPLVANGGKFVKATSGQYEFVYGGPYTDPSVSGSHIVECVGLASL